MADTEIVRKLLQGTVLLLAPVLACILLKVCLWILLNPIIFILIWVFALGLGYAAESFLAQLGNTEERITPGQRMSPERYHESRVQAFVQQRSYRQGREAPLLSAAIPVQIEEVEEGSQLKITEVTQENAKVDICQIPNSEDALLSTTLDLDFTKAKLTNNSNNLIKSGKTGSIAIASYITRQGHRSKSRSKPKPGVRKPNWETKLLDANNNHPLCGPVFQADQK